MIAIARAELTQLLRNRLVAVSALVVPLGFAALFIVTGESAGRGMGAACGLLITALPGFGTFATATTTLASRKQTLFLKRLRCGVASDAGVLAGLLLPVVVVNVLQVVVVFGAMAALDHPPATLWALVAILLLVEAMLVGGALATSAVTSGPDHAQITTLPIFFGVVGVSTWVTMVGTSDNQLLKRLLPGGAATELAARAWTGIEAGEALALLAPTAAWAAIALLAGRLMFRWEPRQ